MTLVEIMAVLLILGITSAIVLPQFGKHDDLKVASAARELVADLLYAQSRAIATGKPSFVQFDPATAKYQLFSSINPPIVMNRPDTELPYEVTFGVGALQDVTIAVAAFDGQRVLAFDASGAPHAVDGLSVSPSPLDEGTIVVRSGDDAQTVSIEPTGQIKVH